MLKKLIIILALTTYAFPLGYAIPQDIANPREVFCLYEALYHEARGENKKGIIAVANVIRNRVYSDRFSTSYCKVIYQPKQFSYVHLLPNRNTPAPTKESYKIMQMVAEDTVKGKVINVVDNNVMWYHAVYVKPKWSSKLKRTNIIGKHMFYKESE